MLLLPELAVFGTVIACAKTTELIAGKRAGLIAAILVSVSAKLMISAGFELRSYGFLIFFGMCTIYYYFKKLKEDTMNNSVKYGIFLILTIYTHYMGILLIGALAAADIVIMIARKDNLKKLIPYAATGVVFAPWFILMLINKQKSITSFWPDKPTMPEIARVMRKLLDGHEALFIILTVTFLYAICRFMRFVLEEKKLSFRYIALLTLSWIVLALIGIVFVYSTVINPAGGFFVQRYFLELVPVMIIIIAVGIIEAIDFLSAGKERELRYEISAVVMLFLVLYLGLINIRIVRDSSSKSSETFREAAAWVKAQDDLYTEGTAVVCSVNPRATAGFVEYYVRDGAKKAALPMISLQDTDPVTDLKKYDRLYFVYVHRDLERLSDEVKDYLAENFEVEEDYTDIKAALYRRK